MLIVRTVVLGTIAMLASAATDPWMGSWVLNRAKSKSSSPQVIPLNSVLTFQKDHGQKILLIQTGRDGSRQFLQEDCTFRYDGKDVAVHGAKGHGGSPSAHNGTPSHGGARPLSPVPGGNPGYDTASFSKTGPSTLQSVVKLQGRISGTHTFSVSSDGRTLTLTRDDFDSNGAPVHTVLLYQK
jgi:hypothetical protein